MKKIILIVCVAVLGVVSAKAQLSYGVTAGLATSSATGDVDKAAYKLGFHVGALLDYAINDQFSIIPELLFTQRGYKIDEDYSKLTLNLNYLQIPVNAAYKFSLPNESKLLVFAGPYVGYALSGKVSPEKGDSHKIKIGSGDNDEVKALDLGFNIGVGYQYEKIFFKLQYNLGFSNIANTENDDYSVKNVNIGVTVGYIF
jgi:hypothetical protein